MVLEIRKANNADLPVLRAMALQMWPGHEEEEMERDLVALMGKQDVAFFLAMSEGEGAGFAQCQLRRDYVEGTSSSPVGYLEGIFVSGKFRNQGLAGNLLGKCETWAREQGCSEFASDCQLSNTGNLKFHLSVGFEEANRIICFVKKL